MSPYQECGTHDNENLSTNTKFKISLHFIYMNMFHCENGEPRKINSPITEFNMENFLVSSINQLQFCRFSYELVKL